MNKINQQGKQKYFREFLTIPLSIFILLTAFAIGCTNRDGKQASGSDTYTCPMHPTVVQNKPGSCPVCGMDLVLKGQPGQEIKINAELSYLLKPTNGMVISNIQTVTPIQKAMMVTSKVNGIISYDTRRFTSIPIRFGGRIESLSIKYNFQPIRKGQKILEIYSPELLTAQRDLLYLLKSDKHNEQLIDGAKERLSLLGITNAQIDHLVSTGIESYSFAVYSPVDGYIVEETTLAASIPASAQPANRGMDGGMDKTGSQNTNQAKATPAGGELLTREGMYVSTGQVIFKVVNTANVWAEFKVYQQDAAFIKPNDRIQISLDDATNSFEAKVNFIAPFFKSGESFSIVRVYLSNTLNQFKVGQLAYATFNLPSVTALWIPISARLNQGTKELVFAKRRGVFRPKVIQTARRSGEWIEVISGIQLNDSIAYNAQFMVDSESFIKIRN